MKRNMSLRLRGGALAITAALLAAPAAFAQDTPEMRFPHRHRVPHVPVRRHLGT